MTHQKVRSTNVYSIAHEDGKMEVRFKCPACDGDGCNFCDNRGHASVYQYEGVDAETFAKVAESGSVGSAFHLLIKGKFKATKLP